MVWCDLMTTDTNKAKDFYTRLMGWSVMPFEGAPEPYDMFASNGAPLGGVMKNPAKGVPPHWLTYVGVDNIDTMHQKALKLGASQHVPPTDIPTVGRFSVIQDPQGAAICLFQPAPGAPENPDTPPSVGEISWYELATSDLNGAKKFYSDLFGWEMREAHDMGPIGVYQIWGRTGKPWPSGGMFKRPPEMPVSAWVLYARVADIQKSTESAKKMGAQIINGPMEVPGGDWIVNFIDPTGAGFALHQSAK